MKKIIAKENMYLYNGTTIASEICLPDDADETIWKEITEEELLDIKSKMTKESDKFDFELDESEPEFDDNINNIETE